MNYKFVLNPTDEDINNISKWKKAGFERKLPGYNLYYSFEGASRELLESQRGYILKDKDNPIAFLTFFDNIEESDKCIKLVHLAVHPGYRRKGIASALVINTLKHFKNHGIVVVQAYHVNPLSKRLNHKLGFQNDKVNSTETIENMYKPLVDIRHQNWTAQRRVVIWNKPTDSGKPTYSWSSNFKKNKKPILLNASYDWYIGLYDHNNLIYSRPIGRIDDIYLNHGYVYITTETICLIDRQLFK